MALLLAITFFIGLNIALPWAITRFIDDLTDIDGKTVAQLSAFLWVWTGIRVSVLLLGRVQIRLFYKAFTRTLKDIDLKSFEITLAQSSDFFANNFTGSVVTKFNRFTRAFDMMAGALMYDMTSLLVQFIFPVYYIALHCACHRLDPIRMDSCFLDHTYHVCTAKKFHCLEMLQPMIQNLQES